MLDRLNLTIREATSKPGSWNPDTRTIEAVIATATPVSRRDAKGEFDEILDPRGADLSALVGASVLDAHRQGGIAAVLGVVESARVVDNEIVATLRMSAKPEQANINQDIADGILRHLSVGYSVEQWTDGTAGGKRTRTAAKWTPREVSFVAVPADRNAHTRNHPMENPTAERNRAIRELASRAGVAAAIVDDLIDKEATIEEAREAVLNDILKRGSIRISSASNRQTLDDPEFFRTTVADALYARIDAAHKPAEAAMQYVGMSMSEIARITLQRAGVSTLGLGPEKLITRAMSGDSTSDFPSLMMNVLNKTLRVAYEAAPSGLKEVARETANVDFRAKWRIMLDSTGIKLDPLTENGEFPRVHMIDGAESYAVSTYGDIFSVTRQALVNDDLNAFGDISRRLGIACAQLEAQTLANFLLLDGGQGPTMNQDGNPLFCAAHKNYVAPGSGAVPSVATLTAARLAMRHQTGMGGGLIHVEPNVLVVPAELETDAEQLITEIYPVTVTDVNPFSKLRKLVVEPRLPPTGWYLVADPSIVDGLEYAYLARSPGPQIESRLGFEVDGLQVRVREDFGGGFVDWRGWYYNAGD